MKRFFMRKVEEKKEEIKKPSTKKNLCRKGTKNGPHEIIDVLKNNNGEKIAVECNCCARKTYHPVVDGEPEWGKKYIVR